MVFLPRPFASSQSVIFFLASAVGRPVMEISGPVEFTEMPSSTKPCQSVFGSGGWTTWMIGRLNFGGELKIARVMRRHGHDGAGAIAGENVIGNPDGNFLAVDRIDGVSAGEHAGFFLGQFGAFEVAFARGCVLDNSPPLRICSAVVISSTRLMFRREHHVSRAKQACPAAW